MALSNNHSLTESHLLICRVMGDLMNPMMGHMSTFTDMSRHGGFNEPHDGSHGNDLIL